MAKTFTRWVDAVAFLFGLIKAHRPLAGNGIVIETTAGGKRISLADTSDDNNNDTTDSFPVVVTGGNNADGHAVDVYANGFGSGKTGTEIAEALELFWDETIPVGTRTVAHKTTIRSTGGSDT